MPEVEDKNKITKHIFIIKRTRAQKKNEKRTLEVYARNIRENRILTVAWSGGEYIYGTEAYNDHKM